MSEEKKYRFETLAVHGGYLDVEEAQRSRVVPIYQSTSFTFKDDKHAANLFALKEFGINEIKKFISHLNQHDIIEISTSLCILIYKIIFSFIAVQLRIRTYLIPI